MMDFLKKSFLVGVWAIGIVLTCQGQDTATAAAAPKTASLSYFKIDVHQHILDCPVLPARLKEKLTALPELKDYTVNRKSETIFFNIPDGALTKEQLIAISRTCGFPPETIDVTVNNKPFTQ